MIKKLLATAKQTHSMRLAKTIASLAAVNPFEAVVKQIRDVIALIDKEKEADQRDEQEEQQEAAESRGTWVPMAQVSYALMDVVAMHLDVQALARHFHPTLELTTDGESDESGPTILADGKLRVHHVTALLRINSIQTSRNVATGSRFRSARCITGRHQAGEMTTQSRDCRVVEQQCRRELDAEVLAQLPDQLRGRQRVEPHLHERSLDINVFLRVHVQKSLDGAGDLRRDLSLDLIEALARVL